MSGDDVYLNAPFLYAHVLMLSSYTILSAWYLSPGSMMTRMKFIRIGLLRGESNFEVLSDLQKRLYPANEAQASRLHPDVPILAAFAGEKPRLLEVLLAAGAAHKVEDVLKDRFNVSTCGLRQLLTDVPRQIGDFNTILKDAIRIATLRRDETMNWGTNNLQAFNLLAELMSDIMTQRLHKRANTLKVEDRDISYEELMSEEIVLFSHFVAVQGQCLKMLCISCMI